MSRGDANRSPSVARRFAECAAFAIVIAVTGIRTRPARTDHAEFPIATDESTGAVERADADAAAMPRVGGREIRRAEEIEGAGD